MLTDDTKKLLRTGAQFSYIGIFFGLAVGLCALAGHWFDKKFGTTPWLAMVGVMLGLIASFRELIRVVKQVDKPNDHAK